MSESSDKLIALSRRQPSNGRQNKRKVQPVLQNKEKKSKPRSRSVSEGLSHPQKISTTLTPPGASKTRPGLVMPSAVKGRIPPFKPSGGNLKPMRKQVVSKRISRSRKTRLKPMARSLLYAMRLLIIGVGIGAIVGTVLSVLDPATRINSASVSSNTENVEQKAQSTQNSQVAGGGLYLSQEITSLKSAVQNLALASPNLTPGVFLVDLNNGGYVDVNAGASFPAASTIKVPILVAFFRDVDAGKIRLDEILTMQQDMVAGGSGNMQYKPVGTQFTVLEVVTKMITISDNTATNMLIAKLGGIEALNERFRSWGLTTTVIRNKLPDLEGTNTTSPKELGNLLGMVNQGNLVSMQSRDRLLDIMRHTERDTLLPSGLGAGATVAHKTGDIGTMLADAGLVYMPNGKRYIATVMIQRPNNDSRAEKLISGISRITYQQFSQNGTPNLTGSTPPVSNYQPPVMTPQTNPMGSTPPLSGYQPPVMTPLPNNTGSYPPPYMNYSPNNMGTNYQYPITNPQYYPQR
ncbi:class A beta-lactamase-related serine hydrolase [Plectonema radiosum NIES-515]|uniref:Class A beta-lactamase-related serine hydrolase n=1 Tax=Plectonema radiosum NIES-515 TaxID=2986073 RepID=A0ABT3B4B6_9CYAN|nr:serine hydrolase [Plectonema radiosum]MCV3216199.1 class A beta-lactamase-related serine hydrolase [Plectonema radiosum NIES-515]